MKKQTTTSKPGALARLLNSTFTAALVLLALCLASSAFAGSATWQSAPTTNNWNTAGNWSPATVPNGPSDTATFATSSKTSVSLSAATKVNGITFNSGASPFAITAPANNQTPLTISGVGITNNSGITQNFVASPPPGGGGVIQFLNSATAGSSTSFTLNPGGFISFSNSSTAANGTFTLNGDPDIGFSSMGFNGSSTAANGSFTLNRNTSIVFQGTSTAANGTFTLNADSVQSAMHFNDSSTAGNGVFTVNGGTLSGGDGSFVDIDSTAGNGTFTINGPGVSGANGAYIRILGIGNADAATLIANAGVGGGGDGGRIEFFSTSLGGTSRVEVFGNGTGDFTDGSLNIGFHNAPGVTIGSIEGSGTVFLGARTLTVGANNRSTIFSGVITDDTSGPGGSLGKIGKGKLSLTKANTYTGGTTITKGALLAKNKSGSATGTGPVQVNSGTLGSTGKISGAVTIGNGSTSGATLLPGTAKKPATLTINSTLTFNSLSTYQCVLNRVTPAAGKVNALGVTINSGATFTFTDTTTGTLTTGTIFTVINNTSASPIAGTFSNLANGAVFASNGNNFQASYTGGTGNDLTLTVQ